MITDFVDHSEEQPDIIRKEEAFISYLQEKAPSLGDPRKELPDWADQWRNLYHNRREFAGINVIDDYFDKEMGADEIYHDLQYAFERKLEGKKLPLDGSEPNTPITLTKQVYGALNIF